MTPYRDRLTNGDYTTAKPDPKPKPKVKRAKSAAAKKPK